jgi:sugar phosphate permease
VFVLIALTGFSFGLIGPLLPAMIADFSPLSARGMTMGVHRTVYDLGAISGAILLAAIAERWDFSLSFSIVSLIAMMGLALSIYLLIGQKSNNQLSDT